MTSPADTAGATDRDLGGTATARPRSPGRAGASVTSAALLPPRRATSWQPTVETRRDCVSPAAAESLHDLLGRPGPAPASGDPVPPLWHWLAFAPRAPQAELGPEGHPRSGRFLPPAQGLPRMCAGGRVTRLGQLRVGQQLDRESTVSQVVSKRGRAGELTFVTVRHDVTATDAVQRAELREDHDLVHRAPGPCKVVRATLPGDITPGDPAWGWSRHLAIDPVLLFRFSALTYDAHRIHYDRDYAVGVEGYPGLVVQGRLQALLLSDAVEQMTSGFVERVGFRAHAPAFDDYSLNLRARVVVDQDGRERVVAGAFSGLRLTMSLDAVLVPTRDPDGPGGAPRD